MLLDLKTALRGLRARPLFTGVALATLAVGIGANAAIFTIIDAVLLRPLPYPRSDRLVAVYTRYVPATGYDFPYFPLSGPELGDLQARVPAFAAVGGYQFAFHNLALEPGDAEAERVLAMAVTPEFFEVLGVSPARGRPFDDADARRGCVAILHHELWGRHFASRGGDAPLGLRLDDRPCEVVGVMPPGFDFRAERVQLWTVFANDASEAPGNRGSHGLLALARLGDGVTVETAEAQLAALRRYWSEQFPGHYASGHFAVQRPLRDDIVGDQRNTLLLIGVAVVFVLLIICANLAGLLVSRGEGRRREFAVRRALGADRFRLVCQVLSETLVLGIGGGALGLVVANWVLSGLLALYPDRLPVPEAVTIDHRGALFALALAIASALLMGLLPALHASGPRLQEALNSEGRTLTGSRRATLSRSLLISAQVAVSVTLLVGALLLIRTYANLQAVDLGFEPRGLLTFVVSIPPGREGDPVAARRLLERIEGELAALPGVENAAAISHLPLVSAGPADDFIIDDRPEPLAGAPRWNARYVLATPSAFETLGMPLKAGRVLRASDTPGQPLVALINETAARVYWAGTDPVGKTIRFFPRETSPAIRIVGVVADVRSLGPALPPPPAIYVPFAQAPRPAYEGRAMTFVMRTHGRPGSLAAPARAAVASVAPGVPLANVRPMDAIVADALGQPRFANIVMSFFAALAIFLAALGLYGVLAFSVEQRRREIAIRVALGASRGEILHLVLRRGLVLAGAGLAIGTPAALVLTRFMRNLLFGVAAADLPTYAGVVLILGVAALLASYLPARRAVQVDPVVALRAE